MPDPDGGGGNVLMLKVSPGLQGILNGVFDRTLGLVFALHGGCWGDGKQFGGVPYRGFDQNGGRNKIGLFDDTGTPATVNVPVNPMRDNFGWGGGQ
jgi:hypothetical protein